MQYLQKRKSAFGYAFKGLAASLKSESHMRIHLLAAVLVVALGFYFAVEAWEWAVLLGCIALVMICELFNTVAEQLCDLISKEQRAEIAYVKDISAAAVLLACLLAVAVGLLVFLPHLQA